MTERLAEWGEKERLSDRQGREKDSRESNIMFERDRQAERQAERQQTKGAGESPQDMDEKEGERECHQKPEAENNPVFLLLPCHRGVGPGLGGSRPELGKVSPLE